MYRTIGLMLLGCSAQPLSAQDVRPRSQLGIEASPTYAGAVTYARRVRDTNVLVGLGIGAAWELNNHTFERQVWNVAHLEGFVRYQPVPWFHGEVGPSFAITSPADDTSETRTFFGVYASAMVGVGEVFFVGPQARFGSLGSELGVIHNVAARFVIPFGRVGG